MVGLSCSIHGARLGGSWVGVRVGQGQEWRRGKSKRVEMMPGAGCRCGIAEPTGEPAPMGQKTKYRDGFIEKAFMTLFARKMEKFASASGSKPKAQQLQSHKESEFQDQSQGWSLYGYESFVEVSKRVMQGRSRLQQQQVVREVLLSMLPPGAPTQFRKLFPPTKWAAEFNAALTVPFFHWLVGPSEVVEVEVNGVKQRSGVLIKKCRYLENSGCVGMCVNMCKIPTQDFFTNEFGLPLTMNPSMWTLLDQFEVINTQCSQFTFLTTLNRVSYSFEKRKRNKQGAATQHNGNTIDFEDMSCEMVYGQTPPTFEGDPVCKQACFTDLCSMANPSANVCPKLQA